MSSVHTPCKWKSYEGINVEDNTISLFMFSQTHDLIYPLKQDCKQYAIHCNKNYGPIFGYQYDILIQGDFTNGYSRLGRAQKFDQNKNGNDDSYLCGQNSPEIKECEIHELQFI